MSLSLTDAITAAQAGKKTLSGADGAVSTEQADVAAKAAVLAAAQADFMAAVDADTAAKSAYKANLTDLIDAANAEISGL